MTRVIFFFFFFFFILAKEVMHRPIRPEDLQKMEPDKRYCKEGSLVQSGTVFRFEITKRAGKKNLKFPKPAANVRATLWKEFSKSVSALMIQTIPRPPLGRA